MGNIVVVSLYERGLNILVKQKQLLRLPFRHQVAIALLQETFLLRESVLAMKAHWIAHIFSTD